jgi:MFS family permease
VREKMREMQTIKKFFSFFSELPPDMRIIITRSSIANLVFNLNTYNSIFIVALGATGTELGLLNSLSLGFTTLAAFTTGWISDRVDRKKMFLMGAIIGILVPITYIIAPTYRWLIPTFFLTGIANGIIQPAWNSMYANSVRNKQRGTIYGIANVFILAPTLLAGIIGGGIVSISGGLNVYGIRPIYYLQTALLITALIIVWSKLGKRVPEQPIKPLTINTMLQDYQKVLARNGVKSWIGVKCLASLGIGLAGPFWMLYAAKVHGASAMIIGYMVTLRNLTQILLSPYSGNLTDRIGRKKMIIGGRIIMYLSTIIFLFFGGNKWILFMSWIFMGLTDTTGIAWQAQEAELVDVQERARIMGLSVAAFNLLAVPASAFGGWLWDNVGAFAPFIVMMFFDGLIRMPIIYRYVPESKNITLEKLEDIQMKL